MIHYDPHHWRSHLCDIRGSMVREILVRMAACVFWSLLVVAWHQAGQLQRWTEQLPDGRVTVYAPPYWAQLAHAWPIAIPLHGHTLIGVALGMLLVFRTNASYDRFWEGRKLWGSIVNDTRNFGRLAATLLKDDAGLLTRLMHWTMVFPWTVKGRLQGKLEFGPAAVTLPRDEVFHTEQAQHVALAVSRRMTEAVDEARRRALISDIQQSLLDNFISRLIDSLGACERIHNTPLPFAYMVHLRRALIMYLMTLPLGLVREFGWATVPATLLIAYVLLGIEEIGVEIEDPFGDDENDLPLESLCETIENNLRGLVPETMTKPE